MTLAFVACTSLAAIALVAPLAPRLFGYRTMIVLSGSMEPDIATGDAVLIEPAEPGDVAVGDVITFRPIGATGLKTHRVIGIRRIGGRLFFQTQGDANPAPDPDLADAAAVVGIVHADVPAVGRALFYAAEPRVRLVLIGFPAALVVLQELVGRRRRNGRVAAAALTLCLAIVVVGGQLTSGRYSTTVGVGANEISTSAVFGS